MSNKTSQLCFLAAALVCATAFVFIESQVWAHISAMVAVLVGRFVFQSHLIKHDKRQIGFKFFNNLSFLILILFAFVYWNHNAPISDHAKISGFLFVMGAGFYLLAPSDAKFRGTGFSLLVVALAAFDIQRGRALEMSGMLVDQTGFIVLNLGVFLCVVLFFLDRFWSDRGVQTPPPPNQNSRRGRAMAVTLLSAGILGVGLGSVFYKIKDSSYIPPSVMQKSGISQAVVMIAFFKDNIPKDPYWRESSYEIPINEFEWLDVVFEHWRISEAAKNDNHPHETAKPRDVGQEEAEIYRYFLKRGSAGNPLVTLDGNFETDAKDKFVLASYSSFERVLSQTGEQAKPGKRHTDMFAFQDPDGLDFNRNYSARNMPKAQALVDGWKKEGLEGLALVERGLAYFKSNLAYHYDYQFSDPERNRLDHFLFTEKKGVCRHFANSFSLLMRMGGVPTRLVVGYRGGDFDAKTKSYTVRARHAHAWTEVWLEGEGWVRVDPTNVVRVEKGLPVSTWSLVGKTFGEFLGQISFSQAGEGGAENKVIPPRASRLIDIPNLVFYAGFALVAFGLMWRWFRRRGKLARAERAWGSIKTVWRVFGFEAGLHQGPISAARAAQSLLPINRRAAWMNLAQRFEAWKYGGARDEMLARDLWRWRWIFAWAALRNLLGKKSTEA